MFPHDFGYGVAHNARDSMDVRVRFRPSKPSVAGIEGVHGMRRRHLRPEASRDMSSQNMGPTCKARDLHGGNEEKGLNMSKETHSLTQLKKAGKLVNRTFRKHGPKSYKRGQGALIKVLHKHGGSATSRELVDLLSFDRVELKNVVKKAIRNGYVKMSDVDEPRTYTVTLTETGEEIAERRCAAHAEVAEKLLADFSEEELAQLDALTEKLIVAAKKQGVHGKRRTVKAKKRRRR